MNNPRKKEFRHDFSGSCSPERLSDHSVWLPTTFSVGIFQWIPYSSGKRKGLKKTAVKYRVKGYASNPKPVYKRAEEICAVFDNAFPHNPIRLGERKSETVR